MKTNIYANKILILLLLLLFSVNNSFSQNVQFKAYPQPNPVTQGEQIQITYSINADGSEFKAPNFAPFKILGGPSQSSQMSFVNGRMSRSLSYTYILQAPEKTGEYTIPFATIKTDGDIVKSNAMKISVVEASAAQKAAKDKQKQEESSLNSQAQNLLKDNIYVTASVDKTSVLLGEPITVTYRLYANRNLQVSLKDRHDPTFNGFWSQTLSAGMPQKWEIETINGQPFQVGIVRQEILIPQQSGKLTIPPMQFDFIARLETRGGGNRQRRSVWDDFFDNRSYKDFEYTSKSKATPVTVRDLPNPKPASFTGGVGKLNFEAFFDKTETKAGEPITLKVKISGTGNFKLIDPLKVQFPPSFEVFDPKVNDNIDTRGISGSKLIEYVVIPRQAGEYKMPEVEFSYYDLDKKAYQTLNSKPFLIKVAKGVGNAQQLSSNANKEQLEYIGKDIRHIKSVPAELTKSNFSFFTSIFFYLLYILAIVFFILFFLWRRKYEEESGNKLLMKNKNATKIAKQRLAKAKELLAKNDKDAFYEEISKALWGYVSDKLGIEYSVLTKQSASEKMILAGVDETTCKAMMNLIEDCEMARFAPIQKNSTLQDIYEDATTLIMHIEGVIK